MGCADEPNLVGPTVYSHDIFADDDGFDVVGSARVDPRFHLGAFGVGDTVVEVNVHPVDDSSPSERFETGGFRARDVLRVRAWWRAGQVRRKPDPCSLAT